MAYITTPIYYVNDDPHIGHIYTTLSADVLSRWHRLSGFPTLMLTGTDEHAAKVVQAAQRHDLTTHDWVDSKAESFRRAFHDFNIDPSDFIRTSEKRHVEQVDACLSALLKSGDIHQGEYEGWYDQGQEEYVSEAKARQLDYCSPINRRPLVRRTESCSFFRLSAYEESVTALIETDRLKIRPLVRKQELLTRLWEGLRDVPCSRPRTDEWGIAIPGYVDQTVYVWIDALLNYLSAVNTDERRAFWPPTLQIVGKDILWFHAVIWPALLLSLQKTPQFSSYAPPEAIHAHSFWIRDGEKMSKSMGNFVSLGDLRAMLGVYGLDALRFFLIARGPNLASDTDFSAARLHETYTSDLANTVGNCCARVTAMVARYCRGAIPEKQANSGFPIVHATALVDKTRDAAIDGDVSALADGALALFRLIDAYIHEAAPFRLAKDATQRSRVSAILHDALEAIRLASLLLWPIMPERMQTVWAAIGSDQLSSALSHSGHAESDAHFRWGAAPFERAVSAIPPLFPRMTRTPPTT